MQPGPILCRMRNRQDYHLHGDSVPTRASQALWSLEKIKKEGPAWIITPLVTQSLGLHYIFGVFADDRFSLQNWKKANTKKLMGNGREKNIIYNFRYNILSSFSHCVLACYWTD